MALNHLQDSTATSPSVVSRSGWYKRHGDEKALIIRVHMISTEELTSGRLGGW